MFKHKHLAAALGWKFNHQPGMSTRNGVLVEFPGGIPTDAQLAQYVVEYEALPVDHPARDKKADLIKRIRAINTMNDVKAILEEMA